uniref:Protein MAK10 homolog n=1 Tax=Caenorhabditis tropicalis TaxID=1561998 RepID=A0A1I7U4P2_9PELO
MTDEMEAANEKEDVTNQANNQIPITAVGCSTDENDISKQFFELCQGLTSGELVTSSNFKMSEAMSAIELMEPKMDVGVGSRHIKTLDNAINMGLYADDYPMQLAVLDATLAMMVGWIDGSSLGSTVWTNIMLANVKNLRHPIFHPFCAGVNLLVRNIHALVNTVGNLEELPEDFNPQALFMTTKWASRGEIVAMIRDQIAVLSQIGKTWTACPRASQICTAITCRLEFVVLLLEIMGVLVPPEIENPHYDQRLGHMVLQNDHAVVNGFQDEVQPEERVDEDKEELKNNDLAKEVVQNMVEQFVGKVAEEGVKKGVEAAAKGNNGGPPSPASAPESPAEDPKQEDEEETEDSETVESDLDDYQFKPNFELAQILVQRMIVVAKCIKDTVILGRKSPDNVDGDYSWLTPFEPKACIRLTPACFPRSVKIPTRQEAADWWYDCSLRIENLVQVCPRSVKDLNTLFYFAKSFTLDADVFTRSLLQVCMFPTDSHLCGHDERTVADPIEVTLINCYSPQVLRQDSPAFKDPECRILYNTFLQQMTKLAITIYSSFGCNLSRQRDRLETALEDLATCQYHAIELDDRIDLVMIDSGQIGRREENMSFQSVVTFVFNNLLATSHHYFELGFRMDLYVPYEFTYIFWFLGDLEARWQMTTMERSREIQLNFYRQSPFFRAADETMTKQRHIYEQEMICRMESHKFNVLNQMSMIWMSEGMIKLTVALIRMKVFRMPDGGDEAERLRFERRFEPYQCLGSPLNVTYEEFKQRSGVDDMYKQPLIDLIDRAAQNFEEGFVRLQKLDNSKEQNQDTNHIIAIAKANSFACKILKSIDVKEKRIEWSFQKDFPIFPVLTIKSIAPPAPKPKAVAPLAEPESDSTTTSPSAKKTEPVSPSVKPTSSPAKPVTPKPDSPSVKSASTPSKPVTPNTKQAPSKPVTPNAKSASSTPSKPESPPNSKPASTPSKPPSEPATPPVKPAETPSVTSTPSQPASSKKGKIRTKRRSRSFPNQI